MNTRERHGALTLRGNPLTVYGEQLAVGDKAPDFTLVANDLSRVTMADYAGKVRLISVVPSLATGICDAQTRRFNEAASSLGDHVIVLTVSADLPFGQKQWCGAAGVERVITLSDHMDMNFGQAYGTHIKEFRLDQRSVFVIDSNDILQYVEYVAEFTDQPNYEAALEAAGKAS